MVRLHHGDVLVAKAWAADVVKRLKATPNYTGLAVDGRFVTGYLGELAVGRLLTQFSVWHSHRVSLTGGSADSEFRVHDGAFVALEVKTASEPTHRRLMMPAAQYDHSAAYVVAARVERVSEFAADVSILGWIPGDRIESLEVSTFGAHNIPTRAIVFEDMNPIGDMLHKLTPVQRIERAA